MAILRQSLISFLMMLVAYSVEVDASVITFESNFAFYAPSWASVYTTERYDSDSRANYDYESFPRFDGSLGRLTDVEISFESLWTNHTGISARDTSYDDDFFQCGFWPWDPCWWEYKNDTSASSREEMYLSVSLIDPVGASGVGFHDYDLLSCSDNGWETHTERSCEKSSGYDSGSFDGLLDLSIFSLGDFVGSEPIDLRFQNWTYLNITCDNNDSGDVCSGWASSNWHGKAKVTYTYTTAEVPVLGTLALATIGLAGIGYRRRRQIKAA